MVTLIVKKVVVIACVLCFFKVSKEFKNLLIYAPWDIHCMLV